MKCHHCKEDIFYADINFSFVIVYSQEEYENVVNCESDVTELHICHSCAEQYKMELH